MGNCCGARPKTKPDNIAVAEHSAGRAKLPNNNPHSSAPLSEKKRDKCKPIVLPVPRSEDDILSSPHLKSFTYNDLRHATRNFRDLIGEGGFGCVYKGWIDIQTLGATKPGCGVVVAVKKLKPHGYQGHQEWLSEVNYLGQLRHDNLVKLIGYCLDKDNRLLVYEYMPKGSLENHLFGRGAQHISWSLRMKVAISAARGLSFLHELEQQVIYRDFKASNILLDSEFNAKLSDFGLAKAGPTGDRSHVSTRVLGTEGYAAPEYIATGHLTSRCDVYSFGVVLLELISGRRAVDKSKVGVEQNLVDWAKPYMGDKRRLFRILDVKLEGKYPKKGAYMAATLALECLTDAKDRPPMTEVLNRLEQIPVPKVAPKPLQSEHQLLPTTSPDKSPPENKTSRPVSPLSSHVRSSLER